MQVNLPVKQQNTTISVGDILVFYDEPYMIIRGREGYEKNKYDLLKIGTGDTYWTGNLDWDRVLHYAEKAEAVYTKDDYILSIISK